MVHRSLVRTAVKELVDTRMSLIAQKLGISEEYITDTVIPKIRQKLLKRVKDLDSHAETYASRSDRSSR